MLALLPARLPAFEKGQRAPGFADWVLEELLGVGGFGEVWKATNPHLPPVALKYCLCPTAAGTLRNEADLLGRVVRQGRHPGIVALLNTALSADPPCLMYEYVEGGDLTGLVQQWSGLSVAERAPEALALLRQLAEVVAFAHRLSPPIVHRDLKPANVLVQAPSAVRVADFGIGGIVSAQAVGALGASARTSRTVPTALRGSCTPLYASPQQWRGEPPSPADDVFALGVIGYQLLTGDLTERPGADWREELAEAPLEAVELLGRCLAARAERRLPDAGALADELARLGRPRAEVVVPLPEEDEEEEDEGEGPLGLATRLQRALLRAQRALARAVELSEQRHDYAGAVRLLEGLPEAFRDNAFLDAVRQRRDRVERLRREVRRAARACRFAGLRDRIDELLELVPDDEEALRLAGVVPWDPGAEVVNSVGMKLVLVPAGKFWMGSPESESGRARDEGPRREVTITRPFYLGAFPVTQEQYRKVTGANPSHFRRALGHDTSDFPVETVSWDDAVAFCRALSELPDERRKGRTYRLPTEAEWEHACRAGTTTPFAFGRALSSDQANFDGRHPYAAGARGDFLQRTSAVGSYPANAWGLFDMHGNVWEWCGDWYAADSYRRAAGQGTERVLRGGSWQNHGRLCRSACRDRAGPGYRSLNTGFRVVMEVSRA